MRNLTYVYFKRLSKNTGFFLLLLLTACLNTVAMLTSITSSNVEVYEVFFQNLPMLSLFIGVFSAMFIGTEYSDGTVRNKLTVGHTRNGIYFSGYVTVLFVSLALTAVWAVSGLICVGGLDNLGLSAEKNIKNAVLVFLLCVVTSAIYTMSATLISNRAESIIVSGVIFITLLIAASAIYGILCEPEFQSGMTLVNGQIVMSEPEPNPRYVSGITRTVLQFILNVLPSGQAILIANNEADSFTFYVCASAILSAAAGFAGAMIFRKKNIK